MAIGVAVAAPIRRVTGGRSAKALPAGGGWRFSTLASIKPLPDSAPTGAPVREMPYETLAEHPETAVTIPQLVAIKESSFDIAQTQQTIEVAQALAQRQPLAPGRRRGRVLHHLGHRALQLVEHALHHRVGFRVHAGSVQRVIAVHYTEEAGGLLEVRPHGFRILRLQG